MINPSRILLGDLAAEYKRVHIPLNLTSEALVMFEGCTALGKRNGLQILQIERNSRNRVSSESGIAQN
jgi:hypothetical protein